MLAVLSPAKSLDYDTRLATRRHTQPRLLEESEQLIEVMRTKSPDEVAELMGISQDLAELNVTRYADFSTPFTLRNARPAVLAFNGDVYLGMQAGKRFDGRDFAEAQKTVRILSGLYGLLRPLDLMQPYRLEMGIGLVTARGRNLYDWWGDTVTELVKQDLSQSPGAEVLVNLASKEYSSVLRPHVLDARIVTPNFLDEDANGGFRVVSFFAKRARGEMAAYLVQQRVRTVKALTRFNAAGYQYDPTRSTPDQPVFIRPSAQRPSVQGRGVPDPVDVVPH